MGAVAALVGARHKHETADTMKILDRYIGAAVVTGTLLVMLVLLALFFFIDFVNNLNDVGKGNYNVLRAVQYVALTQPRRVYELFPLAALLGSMLGLGWLAAGSELTVMRAAGVSLTRLMLSIMKVGAVMMLAVMLIGELIAPKSEQYAQSLRSMALSSKIALDTRYGFWTRDERTFVNIRTLLPGGFFSDIYIYEFDDKHQLRVATHAAKASREGEQWLLEDIVQSEIKPSGVVTRSIARAQWNSLLSADLVGVVLVKPERLSSWDLYKYLGYLRDNGQSTQRYEIALWNKVVAPFTTGVMVFLAIPFVFGSPRSVSMGQQVLVGSLIGIGFHLFNQIFSHVGLVYNLSPLFCALFPTTLFLLAALMMLSKRYWARLVRRVKMALPRGFEPLLPP